MKRRNRILSIFLTALLFLLSAVPAFADAAFTYTVVDGVLTEMKYGCEEEFHVPEGVHTILCQALEGPHSVKKLYIPASVTKIEIDQAHHGPNDGGFPAPLSSSIKAFIVDEANEHFKSIDGVLYSKDGKELISYPLYKDDLTIFNVPEGVEKIGWMSNRYLEEIILPDGVKSISNQAFALSSKLKSVNLPESLEVIEPGVFECCRALEEIAWPSGVTTIEHRMFIGCDNLIRVNLPDTLETIKYAAFSGCTRLTSLTLPESVREIETHALYIDGLTDLVIPNPTATLGQRAYAYERDAGICLIETTLHGTSRSTAMLHALKYNMNFKLIGELDFGDINLDENVDTRDIVELLRYIARWEGTAEVTLENADINLDGAVNNKDATLFLRFFANGLGA